MTSTKMRAKIVRVELKKGKTGLFFAVSPDLQGLLVAESDVDAFERSVPAAIADLYAACGERVVVTRAEDGEKDGGLTPWVAFPVELARLALSEQATR